MTNVIITISGGLVTGIHSNKEDIEVEVIDYDNYEKGTDQDEDKRIQELEKEIKIMQQIE